MGHVLSPAGGGQEGLLGAGWEPGADRDSNSPSDPSPGYGRTRAAAP